MLAVGTAAGSGGSGVGLWVMALVCGFVLMLILANHDDNGGGSDDD